MKSQITLKCNNKTHEIFYILLSRALSFLYYNYVRDNRIIFSYVTFTKMLRFSDLDYMLLREDS